MGTRRGKEQEQGLGASRCAHSISRRDYPALTAVAVGQCLKLTGDPNGSVGNSGHQEGGSLVCAGGIPFGCLVVDYESLTSVIAY